MIIVVTGSRDWRDIGAIRDALFDVIVNEESDRMSDYTLRQGCASGADAIARALADHWGMTIDDYWPDYHRYEFAEANKVRNVAMMTTEPIPDVCLAFPTERSRGTWHAVNAAKAEGIPVRVFEESE